MTKEELYQLAYKTHYNDKDLDKAEQLYLKLIEEFPNTQEVGYAKSQLANIKKAKLTLNSNNEGKFKTQFDQLSAYKNVFVSTTPFIAGYEEVKTIDIVTSECVYGMNIFSDLFASLSDIFGGRSATTQNILKEARINCLNELRKEAYELGGNAVVGVNLEYSEFSGKGKSMLFLVASGTAVVVEKKELL